MVYNVRLSWLSLDLGYAWLVMYFWKLLLDVLSAGRNMSLIGRPLVV